MTATRSGASAMRRCSRLGAELRLVRAAGAAACCCVIRRFALVHLERVAATAGRDGVRVVDREAGRLDRVDVVDLGALKVRGAERIDDDGHAVLLEREVAFGGRGVEAEAVLEAGAAAALDRDPQHADLGLLGEQLLDLRRRRFGQRERWSGDGTLLDLGHLGHRSNVLCGYPERGLCNTRCALDYLVSVNVRSVPVKGGRRCSTTGFRSCSTEASRS